jgi:quinol-cytochrome oxidoreductase complex cytochrome b subunit
MAPRRRDAPPTSDSAPKAPAPGRLAWLSRLVRSAWPPPLLPATDRDRRLVVVHTLLLHFRPVQLPASTLRYTHTFGLGGMGLVLFLLLAASGLLTLFVYEPSPDRAWASVFALETQVPFGSLVRGVHFWSANLLIVVAFLHLLRVFLTGAFRGPREFNWVVGTILLLLILGASLTGYLLPWDQLSFWAVAICTGMLVYVPFVGETLRHVALGGDEVGRGTLIVFHSLHTTVLPATIVLTMALHFWRVRKAGGVILPASDPHREPRLFVPHLLVRELAVGLALVALVVLLAVALPPGLGEPANPGASPNPTKAPWYFAGVQELLMHLHPSVAVLLVPLSVLAMMLLPYLPSEGPTPGDCFLSPRGRRVTILGTMLGATAAVVWIGLDTFVSRFAFSGLLPLAAVAAGLVLLVRHLTRRLGATRDEALQALVAFVFAGFVVFTLTNVFLRGRGMELVFPWNR